MKYSNYAKIFKALSNEQRLAIFMAIYEQSSASSEGKAVFTANASHCCPMEKAFSKMCDVLDVSRSTVSHHFKELQNAGLIICEREGQMFRCRVNEDAIQVIKEFLK